MTTATESQLRYLDTLVAEVCSPEAQARYHQIRDTLDRRTASEKIEQCLARRPTKQGWIAAETEVEPGPLPQVQEGSYAVEFEHRLRFFAVDRPATGKWAGYTFLHEQASDDQYPVKNRVRRRQILESIASDPKAAASAYGRELGTCGCCGKALTDETSRQLGIGPVCAKKRGWA